jgi:hypothetical protein
MEPVLLVMEGAAWEPWEAWDPIPWDPMPWVPMP